MIKKLVIITSCIFLALSTFSGCNKNVIGNSVYQSAINTARTEVWNTILSGATNATIAIMDNGKIVYSEAFGMRDIENSIPTDNNTQFNIGSTSKVFVTSAIMLLYDQRKLDIDKPVTTYLPEFTMQDARYKDITVRMLLNHSSGFPGSNYKDGTTSVKNRNYIKETLASLSKSNLKSNPGEITTYCNDGFTVAEAIVEKLSGTSYSDFLNNNIFSKLNMQNSSCYFKDNNLNIAVVEDTTKKIPKPIEYSNPLGCGGISSTAEDLCKFSTIFYSNSTFFNSKSLKELSKPQYAPRTIPEGIPYYESGLGWDNVVVDQFGMNNTPVLSKTGDTFQYHSALFVAPSKKLSVAIIFGGSADAGSISTKVMQELLKDKGIIKKSEYKKTLPLKTISIPDKFLSYKGYYNITSGNVAKVDFDMQNNTLNLYYFTNGQFVKSVSCPYKEDEYFYNGNTNRFSFSSNYGTKFLMSYYLSSTKGTIYGEYLKEVTGNFQSSKFDNKTWIPYNLSLSDEFVIMAKTTRSNELPNHILYNSGLGYYAAKLIDKSNTKMILPFTRDLYEPKIVVNNNFEILKMGNYEFTDVSKAPVLTPNTKVTIGQNGYNKALTVDKNTIFNCNISRNNRIIVFSSSGTTSYDSLFDGVSEILINAGSYILFIGDAGTIFAPQITQ